jgi:hypothetical protein
VSGSSLNSVFLVGSAILFGGSWIALGRFRREWSTLAGGIALVAADMWFAVRQGWDIGQWTAPMPLLGLLPFMVVMACVAWLDAVGLPPSLAVRIGVGLHSRPLEFYAQLRKEWLSFDRYFASTARSARPGSMEGAGAVRRRLLALQAPDAEWAALRDDLARCQKHWVEIGRSGSEQSWVAQRSEYGRLLDRARLMVGRTLTDAPSAIERYMSRRSRVLNASLAAAAVVAVGVVLNVGSPSAADEWLVSKLLGATAVLGTAFFTAFSLSEGITRRVSAEPRSRAE